MAVIIDGHLCILAFHNCCWINSYLWSYENSQYCARKLVFLGAYAAAYFGGLWLNGGMPIYLVFLVMFITSIFIGILFGAIIERGILKRMYDKDEIVLVLVTYAIFLILEDLIKLIWGVDPYFYTNPMACLEVLRLLTLHIQTIIFLLFASAIVIGLIITYV